MSATHCSDCDGDSEWSVVLCPLHAEAEAMRGLLARLVDEYDKNADKCGLCGTGEGAHENEGGWTGHPFAVSPRVVNQRIVELARPILTRIDGDTPDA